jgi:hypothetical protein
LLSVEVVRVSGRLALAALAALSLLTASASAEVGASASAKKHGWRTLHARGGFRIKAPRGYRVKLHRGAYEVAGPGGTMTLLALRTDGSARAVAAALLGDGLPATPNPNQFGLLVRQRRGGVAEVYFDRTPGGVAVTALVPPKGRGKRTGSHRHGKRGTRRRAEFVGATASARRIKRNQRRLFARMARSARNVRALELPTQTTQEQEAPIPLKPFTTADGSAKAMVPDAPGWAASGSQGVVEGGNADLGSFAFGVLGGFFEGCFFPPCPGIQAPFMPVADALERAWPLWLNQAGANVSNMKVVSQVPGSGGVLGPGMDSGMFQVSFDSNGKPGLGYVMAGVFTFGEGIWYLYYSYIAAYVGVPGNVGDALLRTWQSWDPSVDQAKRQAQTFVTLQETTQIIQSVNEYRRKVYEKTNYNWDAYIRGKDPVLDPVAPGVIGEGNQTLVQGPDGKLFNFAGNQFKTPGE